MRYKIPVLLFAALTFTACAPVENKQKQSFVVPGGRLSPDERKLVGRWVQENSDHKVGTVIIRYPDRTFFKFSRAEWYCGEQNGPSYLMGRWGYDGNFLYEHEIIIPGDSSGSTTGTIVYAGSFDRPGLFTYIIGDVISGEEKTGGAPRKMPASIEHIFEQPPQSLAAKRRYYEKMILGYDRPPPK